MSSKIRSIIIFLILLFIANLTFSGGFFENIFMILVTVAFYVFLIKIALSIIKIIQNTLNDYDIHRFW